MFSGELTAMKSAPTVEKTGRNLAENSLIFGEDSLWCYNFPQKDGIRAKIPYRDHWMVSGLNVGGCGKGRRVDCSRFFSTECSVCFEAVSFRKGVFPFLFEHVTATDSVIRHHRRVVLILEI
jgi:hypothetical protein